MNESENKPKAEVSSDATAKADQAPSSNEKAKSDTASEPSVKAPKPAVLNLPPISMVEAKPRFGAGKMLMLGLLTLSLGGFFVCSQMGARRRIEEYASDWVETITSMPCTPHDEDSITPTDVLLFFGSYRDQAFLFGDKSKLDSKTQDCISEQIAFRSFDFGPEDDLVYGSVLVRFDPHAPTSIGPKSLEISRIHASWRMDSHSAYEAAPGTEQAMKQLETETSAMWNCWVQFGVFKRQTAPVFNRYTGDQRHFLFRLQIASEGGGIKSAFTVRPKRKNVVANWQDGDEYNACLNEAVQTSSDWPKSPNGRSYGINAQLTLQRQHLDVPK